MSNLRKNDLVSIISPSASIQDNPEALALCQRGEKIITDLGLRVVYGAHAQGKNFYKSGTAAERVSDINDAFENSEVKAIFCTQGGDNSNELLPLINWKVIEDNHKFFFGTSDITVLLNGFYSRTGLNFYHGLDVVWGLGKNASMYTVNQLKNLLFRGMIDYQRHPDYPEWRVVRSGKASGICLGGCLASFILLLGTDNDPLKEISKPFIFIIEDIGESYSRIEAYVAQLFQQPNFIKYCRGIIIGYFFLCQEKILENNRMVGDIISIYARNLNFPIVEIKELGHAVENLIFPIGGQIEIIADADRVILKCIKY